VSILKATSLGELDKILSDNKEEIDNDKSFLSITIASKVIFLKFADYDKRISALEQKIKGGKIECRCRNAY